MLSQGQPKVTGLPVSRVDSVIHAIKYDHNSENYEDVVDFIKGTLRKLAPCPDRLEAQNLNQRQWTE